MYVVQLSTNSPSSSSAILRTLIDLRRTAKATSAATTTFAATHTLRLVTRPALHGHSSQNVRDRFASAAMNEACPCTSTFSCLPTKDPDADVLLVQAAPPAPGRGEDLAEEAHAHDGGGNVARPFADLECGQIYTTMFTRRLGNSRKARLDNAERLGNIYVSTMFPRLSMP